MATARSLPGRAITAMGEQQPQPHLPDFRANPLDQLPLDILVLLRDCLDPVEHGSLSLTSKALYESASPSITKLSFFSPGRRQLLRLLERDSPELLFCTGSNRLYSWNFPRRIHHRQVLCGAADFCDQLGVSDEDWSAVHDRHMGMSSEHPFPDRSQPDQPPGDVHRPLVLTTELRDLILRYEEHKDSRCRFPIQLLDHVRLPRDWRFKMNLHLPRDVKIAACIVNGSLIIRCERRFDVDRLNMFMPWQRNIHVTNATFCSHQENSLNQAVRCAILHGHKTKVATHCKSMIHCAWCKSDWLITVADAKDLWDPPTESRIQVWITTWHDCGRRSDPATTSSGYRPSHPSPHSISPLILKRPQEDSPWTSGTTTIAMLLVGAIPTCRIVSFLKPSHQARQRGQDSRSNSHRLRP